MKLINLLFLLVLSTHLVTAQETKELQKYTSKEGVKIKTGMYFTILYGDHHEIKDSNFWDIPGAGKISSPIKLFSYLNEGNTYQIKRIIHIKGTKTVWIGFIHFDKMIYAYVDRAIQAKEIEIKKRLNIDSIVKI